MTPAVHRLAGRPGQRCTPESVSPDVAARSAYELFDIGLAGVAMRRVVGCSAVERNRAANIAGAGKAVSDANDGRALVKCGLYLHLGLTGPAVLATGIVTLSDRGSEWLAALVAMFAGSALAAIAWKRARAVLEPASRAPETKVQQTAAPGDDGAGNAPIMRIARRFGMNIAWNDGDAESDLALAPALLRSVTESWVTGVLHALHMPARAHRSAVLREVAVAAIHAAGTLMRRVHARYRQRRQMQAACAALRGIDDQTLHDLGFDRSEIRSVAAEVSGETEPTRVRTLARSQPLPGARRA